MQREAVQLLLLQQEIDARRALPYRMPVSAPRAADEDDEPGDEPEVEVEGDDPFADPEAALDFAEVEFQDASKRSLEDDQFLAKMLEDDEVTVVVNTDWA